VPRRLNLDEQPSWVRVVPLVALWAVPLLAISVALPLVGARDAASVAPALPEYTVVGTRSNDHRVAVDVIARLAPAREIRSQASGLVTELSVSAGPIATGQKLIEVNGVPVLAFRGSSPLYRDLQSGATGDDVEALGHFLVSQSVLSEADVSTRFGAAMRAAVRAFQKTLGSTPDGVFRVSYVAFVPDSVDEVDPPTLAVGDSVNPGDPILLGGRTPLALSFDVVSDGVSLASLADAPLVLRFGNDEIAIPSINPNDDLSALFASMRLAASSGIAESQTAEDGESISFSGGVLALAEGEARGVLPATAIYIAASGTQCVYVVEDSTVTVFKLEVVEPAVGDLGSAFVDVALADSTVVRDALSVAAETRAQCA
jgi:peptidoglycan hydrolase-like protein with peptidoglycan-binding domain